MNFAYNGDYNGFALYDAFTFTSVVCQRDRGAQDGEGSLYGGAEFEFDSFPTASRLIHYGIWGAKKHQSRRR